MDIYNPKDTDSIGDLLKKGQFNPKEIDDYVYKWKSRFNLFDKKYPFYQAPETLGTTYNEKTVTNLFREIPSGNNFTFFFHGFQGRHAISPASCARALCTFPPFATTGGRGFAPSINGVPPWYVLILGENLFETLILNSFVLLLEQNSGDEPVAWKSKTGVKIKKTFDFSSTLQGLTWQPRYIRLIPGEGGICTLSNKQEEILIRKIIFEQGWKFKKDKEWIDPYVAYSIGRKGRIPLRPKQDRQLWRDIGH